MSAVSDAREPRSDQGPLAGHVSAWLAAIIDSSDDAIVSKTLDGVITSWNRGAERIFGYRAAEAVGQRISLIIPRERLAEEDTVLAQIVRGEKVDHFETVRRTKDGRLIDISLTVSPVRDGAGRIIGASKIARDITERRRIEAERDALLVRVAGGTRGGGSAESRQGRVSRHPLARAADATERDFRLGPDARDGPAWRRRSGRMRRKSS